MPSMTPTQRSGPPAAWNITSPKSKNASANQACRKNTPPASPKAGSSSSPKCVQRRGRGWNILSSLFVLWKIAEFKEKDHEKDFAIYSVCHVFDGGMWTTRRRDGSTTH